MPDPRVVKLADVLVNYSTAVRPGDWVFIRGHVAAMPLVEELLRHVLRAGGRPNVVLSSDELQELMLREASDEQLQWVSPIDEMMLGRADVYIAMLAAHNTHALTNIDPRKLQVQALARRDLIATYMRRMGDRSLRAAGTLFPTTGYAQDADMSLPDFEDFAYAAMFVDQPDPVARWQEMEARQQRLVEWLDGKKQVVVRSPNAELTLSIVGRRFINDSGHVNMPGGEIFTSPIEDSVNGWVKFSFPSVRNGVEVDGVSFDLRDGRVVRASAQKNEAYLLSQLDVDAQARTIGEWAIGTNYNIQRFTKSILYDEKIGGTMHMAIGSGFPEIGGKNQSSVHWDFICDLRQDSEIFVDGALFYKNGEFQV